MKVLSWILSKVNGWKSVLGWLIAKSAALILGFFPDFPVAEYVVVLEYVGEALLAFGLTHIAVKNVKN